LSSFEKNYFTIFFFCGRYPKKRKMKFKPRIYFIAVVFLISSCKKDTAIISSKASGHNSTTSVSYLPLAVGNYWVYQMFSLDTGGAETAMNKIDSVYIQKDSIIGGKTYYYFCQSDSTITAELFPLKGLIIDSSGFLKYYGGEIILDPVHINDTLKIDTATWKIVYYTIPILFSNTTVPAGVYSGVGMKLKMQYLYVWPFSDAYPPAYTNFVLGLGLCFNKGGYASEPKAGFSWKLLRYHI
jgi:hypothetical protein